MSRGFIKEGDQEAIPMVPPRAYLPEGVPNYVTKEGLAALNEELKGLETERAKTGDNYIMSNFIEAKMKLLINRISSAVEVDLSKAKKDMVSFGAWVRFNGRVVRIVGVDEADVNKGLISFISPLAKSLAGKRVGDVFELNGPGGLERIMVEEVSFEPMPLTQMAREKQRESSPAIERKSPQTTIKEPMQIAQVQPVIRDNEIDLSSSEVEKPRLFNPEADFLEFLPIVNERGNIVGRGLNTELHRGQKMLHPVVHLHVINGQGKTIGRYWWHVAFGDTPEKTLRQKMEGILSLSGIKPKLKRQYIREAMTEKELVYVFTAVSEEVLPPTPEGKDYIDLFAKD